MRAFLMTVLLMISSNSFASSQIQKGAPWPMFGRNQLHTSNSPFTTGSTTPLLRWKLPVGSPIESSPSIGADGTIYFGTDAGTLYAVNSKGEILWSYKAGGAILSTPALSAKDMIFFGSWDKYIYALQASTGILIWKYKVGDIVSASPVIDDSNTIYLGAGNTFYAILDTGELKWNAAVRGISASSPALSKDGTLFLTTYYSSNPYNSFYSLSSVDGKNVYPERSFSTGGPLAYSSPMIGEDGSVYVGSSIGDSIFKFDQSTTKLDILYLGYVGESFVFSPLAFSSDGKVIYFGSGDGVFYAVDSNSGMQNWNITTTSAIVTGATVTRNGIIIFGNIDGNVYGMSSTGKIVWRTLLARRSNTPAIGADGTVYLTTYGGTLYAIGGDIDSCPLTQGLSPNFTQYSTLPGVCVVCYKGTYASQSMCNSCSKGTYANVTGSTVCGKCNRGTYAPTVRTADCTVASKGTYVGFYGASVSTKCFNGTYAAVTGSSTCINCAAGSISFRGATVCTACPAGQYSVKSLYCSPCKPGSYSGPGSSGCTNCPIGTYAGMYGSANCTVCGPGSVSTGTGSSTCTACGSGTYASSVTTCSNCEWPTYSLDSGSNTECSYYLILRNRDGVKIGTIIVLISGVLLYIHGIFKVDEFVDSDRGILVTKYGVFLFFLIPFLDSLSTIIYLFYSYFSSKIVFILFILFVVFSPVSIFLSFLITLKAKPKLSFIILFPLTIIWFVFGLFLHQSRTITIKKVWDFWFFTFTDKEDFGCKCIGLESSYTNRLILYSSILETLPLLILQIINNVNTSWNPISIISFLFSVFLLIKSLLRFPFDSLNSPIGHIPITVYFRHKYLDTTGFASLSNNPYNNNNNNNNFNSNFSSDIMPGSGSLDAANSDPNILVLDCGAEAVVADVTIVRRNIIDID